MINVHLKAQPPHAKTAGVNIAPGKMHLNRGAPRPGPERSGRTRRAPTRGGRLDNEVAVADRPFAGIGVYIHATFLLILGWVVLSHWLQGHTVAATVAGVVFMLALFGCILLHEFGHALMAKKYGIRTRDITLLPIGGVARLERMPDEPRQELWVALAGPAVNVVIAAALYAWLTLSDTLEPLGSLGLASGSFWERLMVLNVFVVVFNLIPAFPMDGGRVLRALLAMRLEYTRATQIAATVGQGLALVFGFVGLFTNPFLLFIALFVWIGAGQEAGMVQMKAALGGIPVSRAMITDFQTLAESDTLETAVTRILAGLPAGFSGDGRRPGGGRTDPGRPAESAGS